jgi:hypothetical protein
MSRKNNRNVYTAQEKADIADEFSPALAEVLETIAPVWGNKVRIDESNVHPELAAPSALLKIRQLGDKGLVAVMNSFGKKSQ